MRKVVVVVGVAAVIALSMSACGTSSRSAGSHVTTSIAQTALGLPATTVAIPAWSQLNEILIIPSGFAPAISNKVANAAVDDATFDKDFGTPGLAASLGFVGGWDETYQADVGYDYVEVALFQFYSASQAQRTAQIFVAADKHGGAVASTFAAIPGAIETDFGLEPKGSKYGTYEHDVDVAKGDRMMGIWYFKAAKGPVAQLNSISVNQYKVL